MWTVVLLDEVEDWYLALAGSDAESAESVTAAIDLLEDHGPALGRPTADRLKGSSIHNLKELRPSATSIRILFVFDPERNAVLLVAGDKSGDWKGWYRQNVPVAEDRYQRWLGGEYDKEDS